MPSPNALFVMPYVIARERLTRADLGRRPEPMVMDEPEGVAAFHEAGQVDGANMPVYEIWAKAMSRHLPEGGSLLDLGSGSGRFLAHLARHRPDLRIVGLDLSDTMLATGRRLLEEEGLSNRISLLEADMTRFDAEVPMTSTWSAQSSPFTICQRSSIWTRVWRACRRPGRARLRRVPQRLRST